MVYVFAIFGILGNVVIRYDKTSPALDVSPNQWPNCGQARTVLVTLIPLALDHNPVISAKLLSRQTSHTNWMLSKKHASFKGLKVTIKKSHLGAPKPSHVAPSGGLRVLQASKHIWGLFWLKKSRKRKANNIAANVFYTVFLKKMINVWLRKWYTWWYIDLEEMANDNGRWMMMSDGKSGK